VGADLGDADRIARGCRRQLARGLGGSLELLKVPELARDQILVPRIEVLIGGDRPQATPLLVLEVSNEESGNDGFVGPANAAATCQYPPSCSGRVSRDAPVRPRRSDDRRDGFDVPGTSFLRRRGDERPRPAGGARRAREPRVDREALLSIAARPGRLSAR